jgi:ABC-type uncharacterized transport system substrate-binding protein
VLALAPLALLLTAMPAAAHPHVFPIVKITALFDEAGRFSGAHVSWVFDYDFSAIAKEEADTDKGGYVDDMELAAYTERYLGWVPMSDYMTRITVEGRPVARKPVEDYAVKFFAAQLYIDFTVPLETPVAVKTAGIDVFDPEFYYDFEFGYPDFDAVNQPAACIVDRREAAAFDPVAVMIIKKLGLPVDPSLIDDPATGYNVRIAISC